MIEGYNENLLQINVHFKPISGHFREKNNKRCQISQVETIIFGIACSCTSIETKVMERNVNCCVFMFFQFCKKKFAKVFEMENCL